MISYILVASVNTYTRNKLDNCYANCSVAKLSTHASTRCQAKIEQNPLRLRLTIYSHRIEDGLVEEFQT